MGLLKNVPQDANDTPNKKLIDYYGLGYFGFELFNYASQDFEPKEIMKAGANNNTPDNLRNVLFQCLNEKEEWRHEPEKVLITLFEQLFNNGFFLLRVRTMLNNIDLDGKLFRICNKRVFSHRTTTN